MGSSWVRSRHPSPKTLLFGGNRALPKSQRPLGQKGTCHPWNLLSLSSPEQPQVAFVRIMAAATVGF